MHMDIYAQYKTKFHVVNIIPNVILNLLVSYFSCNINCSVSSFHWTVLDLMELFIGHNDNEIY